MTQPSETQERLKQIRTRLENVLPEQPLPLQVLLDANELLVMLDTRAPVDSQGAETLHRASVAAPPPDFRAALKPEAWHCQRCATRLFYNPNGSPTYSCEHCEMMWPAENIVLFAYADLVDENFAATVAVTVDAETFAAQVVGSVFDNTAASHETLKATMIERIADAVRAPAPSDSSIQAAAAEIATWMNWKSELPEFAVEQNATSIAAILSKHLGSAAVGPNRTSWTVDHSGNPNAFCLACQEHPCKLLIAAATPTSTEDAAGGGGRST